MESQENKRQEGRSFENGVYRSAQRGSEGSSEVGYNENDTLEVTTGINLRHCGKIREVTDKVVKKKRGIMSSRKFNNICSMNKQINNRKKDMSYIPNTPVSIKRRNQITVTDRVGYTSFLNTVYLHT